MRTSKPLLLSDTQREIVHTLANRRTSRADVAERSAILLDYERTKSKTNTVQNLHSTWDKVSRWVNRWHAMEDGIKELESAYQRNEIDTTRYCARIATLLRDEQRLGAPRTFTESQRQQILALATQKPEDVGVPITHWSRAELARVAVEKGVVNTISCTHIGRFLKGSNTPATS